MSHQEGRRPLRLGTHAVTRWRWLSTAIRSEVVARSTPTIREVAELFDIECVAVYVATQRGQFHARKVGRTLVFDSKQVRTFYDASQARNAFSRR